MLTHPGDVFSFPHLLSKFEEISSRTVVGSHYMELTLRLSLGRKSQDELVPPEAPLPWALLDVRTKLYFLSLLTVVFPSNDISSLVEW